MIHLIFCQQSPYFPGSKVWGSAAASAKERIRSAALVLLIAVALLLFAEPGFCEAPSQNHAAEARKMTLADAVFVALTNNVTLRSAYLDRHLQRIDLQIAERRNYLPTDPSVTLGVNRFSSYTAATATTDPVRTEDLNFTGDFSATLAIPTGGALTFLWNNTADRPDPGQSFSYSSGWTAVFTQPLLKGGGLTNAAYNVRIARITEETNIMSLKDTIAATIKTAITAFRSYKSAERQLVIARMGLVRARALYDYNKDMIQAGRLAGTEIVQAQADIATQETQVIDAENSLDNARLALIQALNIDKNTVFEAVDENQRLVAAPLLEDALSLAFQYRTDYLRALKNLEATRLTLSKAKRNRLWSLDLTAATTDSYAASALDRYDAAFRRAFNNAAERDWYAGLSLNIPLVYMTADMRSYYGAKNDLEKATLALDKLKLDIEIRVLNAVRNVDSGYRSQKSATLARELAEKKLQIEQEKLSAGRTTNFQFVSFQRDLQTAQKSESDAMTTYLNSLTDLDDTLGTTLATWKIDVGKEDDRIRQAVIKNETSPLKP
ncbi:MAG: TolC family protein [Deltaproteobacteria bacterium]